MNIQNTKILKLKYYNKIQKYQNKKVFIVNEIVFNL